MAWPDFQHWTIIKDAFTLLVGTVVAGVGAFTYMRNATTRRAELLTKLHQEFFVNATYREIRKTLDDETADGEIAQKRLVDDEPEAFIEFLNFFELAAYFAKLKTFKKEDLHALLGYYLRLLRKQQQIYTYICKQDRSFETLKELLGTLTP